jgi:hypothetical protein
MTKEQRMALMAAGLTKLEEAAYLLSKAEEQVLVDQVEVLAVTRLTA